MRLAVALVLGAIGSVGMWSFVVALPAVQADFGIARGEASLPFTLTMFGFGIGGVVMGRLADRFGIVMPVHPRRRRARRRLRALGHRRRHRQFALAQGLLGFGSAATFGPLMTDISHWFVRRRGIAVAIVVQRQLSRRHDLAADHPAFHRDRRLARHPDLDRRLLHRRDDTAGRCCCAAARPRSIRPLSSANAAGKLGTLGISANALMVLLFIAGIACCVAMAMPQVHIVAYCGDLGYGPARGAEMLSMMLGFGLISRIASGFIADRIGGVATLLLSSVLQGVALLLYMFFDGLFSLYVISALFGLFQGGIVPMYAIIVREYFAPQRGRHAARPGAAGDARRHGARRLDVRR